MLKTAGILQLWPKKTKKINPVRFDSSQVIWVKYHFCCYKLVLHGFAMKHQKIRWTYNKYSMCIYIYMFTSTVVDQVLVTPPSWSVSKHETGHGFGENAMSNDLKKFLRSKKATASVFCFWWKYHQSRYRNLRYRLILKQRRRWYRGRAIPRFCSARKVCNLLELSHEKIRSTFHYTGCLIGIEINGLL